MREDCQPLSRRQAFAENWSSLISDLLEDLDLISGEPKDLHWWGTPKYGMHPCIETITTIQKVTNRMKMVIHAPVPSFFSQPQLTYFYNLVQFYRFVTRVPSQSVQSLQASQNFF